MGHALVRSGAVIRDCHFHDAYDGVMQLRSSGSRVEANRFEHEHSMTVATGKSWLEGAAGLHEITVIGNVFTGCCTPKASTKVVRGEGCDPISLVDCTNCVQRNNTVLPAN